MLNNLILGRIVIGNAFAVALILPDPLVNSLCRILTFSPGLENYTEIRR